LFPLSPARAAPPPQPSHDPRAHGQQEAYRSDQYKSDYRYKKKKNLLGELFDF
jgi:uncharacterized protein